MSRIYKFRAWDGKRFINPKEFHIYGDGVISAISLIDSTTLKIMQFTGLLDKNGKKIYEGDLVKYGHCIKDWHDKALSGNHQVIFEGGRFVVHGGYPKGIRSNEDFNYYPQNWEVIGNIYENGDLISGG